MFCAKAITSEPRSSKEIIDELVEKGLIVRIEEPWGAKRIIKYRVSERGTELAREILEPYEALFPRSEAEGKSES